MPPLPRRGKVPVQIVPLREELTGRVQRTLVVFQAAVVRVLVIACLNVTNRLLIRQVLRGLGSGRGTAGGHPNCDDSNSDGTNPPARLRTNRQVGVRRSPRRGCDTAS